MLRTFYRLILRLYPEEIRREHGAEMEAVFLHCVRAEQGARPRVLWPLIWLRGLADALGFAVAARRSTVPGPAMSFPDEMRWAMRGIRSRGWSAVLSVALMASALAASTLVFSSADALIFNRVPYPEAERLVTVPRAGWRTFADLRRQTDVFSGVAGHQTESTFLLGAAGPEPVSTIYATPGLFETIGVMPQWGRPFVDADRLSINPTFAIVGADLARRHFGSPSAAVGQTLATVDRTLTIVGVMPPGFRYPNGLVQIWRALDYERIDPMFRQVNLIARLASDVSQAVASTALTARMPELILEGSSTVEVAPYEFRWLTERRVTTLHVLLGAGLCLLLAACANVASLELAGGLRRARAFSVQMALGASRVSLVRIALLEGTCLAGLSLAIACGLAMLGASVLTSILPDSVTIGGLNPIDVDWRALSFLMVVTFVVWLLASLPVVIYASRPNLLHVLKGDGRGVSVSRVGAFVRRAIITVEVALAVMLLVGGLLYVRTYTALIGVETGLDTHGVVRLSVAAPMGAVSGNVLINPLMDALLERLSAFAPVVSAARVVGGVPPGNAYTMRTVPEVEGATLQGDPVSITAYDVDPAFFETVNLAAVRGRLFDATDPPSHVVVSETFARYLWGDAEPVGRAFRFAEGFPWLTIVGVVPHVRTERDDLGGPSATAFSFFRPPAPPPMRQTPAATSSIPVQIVNAPTGMAPWRSSTILVRLSDPSRANELLTLARSVNPRARYTVEPLDHAYASRHAETRMATSIVTAFAVVAFLIAVAGVFGVMTFLVSSRTREIGIRMALGADQHRVSRMVLGSSLRFVLAGVGLGIAAAIVVSRFIESQLFGVTPTDPLTFGVVSAAVVVAATLAAWHPARRAARVDPAVTLRAE